MMKFSTAVARIVTTGLLMTLAGSAAAQQAYPSKPIRFVTPYPPGGSTTAIARLIAQKLTESWGQQVIVDNRPGGDTIIGTQAFVKSPPDGYTILLAASAHVIVPFLHRNVPYDVLKDFAAVASLGSSEQFLVLHPSVPANNLQEFIALAKSKPGQLNFASSGNGNSNHLAMELFNIIAGIKIQHIPYKGGGQAVTDLIGGQVQSMFSTPVNVGAHIKSGRLKPLAISGETRLPAFSSVPTFTEAGVPGIEAKIWYGVLAPAGTPRVIIDKMSSEMARILAMPDTKDKLAGQGQDPFISTPEQFATLMKADFARYGKVIKAADIKIE